MQNLKKTNILLTKWKLFTNKKKDHSETVKSKKSTILNAKLVTR